MKLRAIFLLSVFLISTSLTFAAHPRNRAGSDAARQLSGVLRAVTHLQQHADTVRLDKLIAEIDKKYSPFDTSKVKTSAEYEMLYQIYTEADKDPQAQQVLTAWYDAFGSNEKLRSETDTRHQLALAKHLKANDAAHQAQAVSKYTGEYLSKLDPKQVTISKLYDLDRLSRITNDSQLNNAVLTKLNETVKPDGYFKKEIAPFELPKLVAIYRANKKSSSVNELASFIVNDYLPEPGLAFAIPVQDWPGIIDVVTSAKNRSLNEAIRGIVVNQINSERFRPARLSHDQIKELCNGLKSLNIQKNTIQNVVSKWLGAEKEFAALDIQNKSELSYAVLSEAGSFESLNLQMLEKHSAGKLSFNEYKLFAAILEKTRNVKTMQQWAEKVLIDLQARKQFSVGQLYFASKILPRKSRSINDQQLELLAEVIASFDNRSVEIPDSTYKGLAKLYKSDDRAKLLEAQMVDSHGQIKLTIVKVISWRLAEMKKVRPFRVKLKEMISERNPEGDSLARWYLGIAYSSGLMDYPKHQRRYGRGWVDKAIAAAKSDSIRLLAIQEMAAAYEMDRNYSNPIQTIKSVKGQFSGKEAQILDSILNRLTKAKKQQEIRIAAIQKNNKDIHHWRQVFINRPKG